MVDGCLVILENSYHLSIEIVLNHHFSIPSSSTYNNIIFYNYNKCNFDNLGQFLNKIYFNEHLKILDLDLAIVKVYFMQLIY